MKELTQEIIRLIERQKELQDKEEFIVEDNDEILQFLYCNYEIKIDKKRSTVKMISYNGDKELDEKELQELIEGIRQD